MVFINRVATLSLAGALATSGAAHAVEPLTNAHAHNDYWHERPLFDALDRGFTSVESDVFLDDGKLLVGHDREELNPERSLESLYLEPLARRVRENGGRVHKNGERFFLLIDIKSDAPDAYARMHELLSNYAAMLTVVDGGELQPGALTVVITGNRPIAAMLMAGRRYAGLDGRLTDLDSDLPSHVMPMISDKWSDHFTWNGEGDMPADEQAKLQDIVTKAHRAGRAVRFWATPENESVWRQLRSADVDLIGTDRLDQLADFLRGQ